MASGKMFKSSGFTVESEGFVRYHVLLVVSGILGRGWTQDIHLHCQLFSHASFSLAKNSRQRVRREVRKVWTAKDSKRINKNEVQMIFQFLISTVVNLYDTNPKKALIRWKYLTKGTHIHLHSLISRKIGRTFPWSHINLHHYQLSEG